MLLALTGNFGCGKTTAANLFQKFGLSVSDADATVHSLLESDSEIQTALTKKFGPEILNTDQQINRKALAGIVFKNRKALLWLEDLLHPKVRATWLNLKTQNKEIHHLVEVPLLFEKNYEADFDFTLCVASDENTLRKRLHIKGFSDETIAERMARLLPLEEKMQRADAVLLNNGTIEFLSQQIEIVLKQLKIL